MTAGFRVLLAPVLLIATAAPVRAQQRPVPPPPAPPVSLTVPDPFAGMHPAGPDMYQSPDGSDRYAAGSRYPASSLLANLRFEMRLLFQRAVLSML